MPVSQCVRDAQNKYNAKFELVQLKLPKGTKERIKNITGNDESVSGYCKQAVLSIISVHEDLLKDGKQPTTSYAPIEPVICTSKEVLELKDPTEPKKCTTFPWGENEPTAEDVQRLIEEKRKNYGVVKEW